MIILNKLIRKQNEMCYNAIKRKIQVEHCNLSEYHKTNC